jgi:hypothetical protein
MKMERINTARLLILLCLIALLISEPTVSAQMPRTETEDEWIYESKTGVDQPAQRAPQRQTFKRQPATQPDIEKSDSDCCSTAEPTANDEANDRNDIPPIPALSELQQIALVEIEILGKTHPQEDATRRLQRVERAIFDQDYDGYAHSTEGRLKNIMQVAPPSDELIQAIQVKASRDPDWFKESRGLGWVNSLVQRTSLLELAMYKEIPPSQNLRARIGKLEADTYGKSANKNTLNLNERTNSLVESLNPPDELIEKAVNTSKLNLDWFLHPGAPTLSAGTSKRLSAGANKIYNLERSSANKISRLLSSPTLWTLLVGGAALYGAYMLNRNASPGYIAYPEQGCCGSAFCTACTNCLYCKHCQYPIQPCGVYYRVRGNVRF